MIWVFLVEWAAHHLVGEIHVDGEVFEVRGMDLDVSCLLLQFRVEKQIHFHRDLMVAMYEEPLVHEVVVEDHHLLVPEMVLK